MSTLRAILKYRAYWRILAIQNKCKSQIKFTFKEINLVIIEKDIHNLKINKASQSSNISTKIIKFKIIKLYFCRSFMEKHKQLN